MTDLELAQQDEAALRRRRFDYEPEQVRLIKATVAEGATDAELGMFLELSARYGLDPFAREIWCVKTSRQDGGPGKMLIMVGRDGLRKLARRAKARVDQDVVREHDTFQVERTSGLKALDPIQPFEAQRAITHSYNGTQATRGPIVGAWCEVITQDSYGWFYAPLEEYLPTSEAKLRYSPWGSQRSVMILAAAERQALRMAIPLSGVLVEGEMDLNEERAAGEVSLDVDIAWPPGARARLEPLFGAINALAPYTYGAGAIDLLVRGQDPESLTALASRLEEERDALVAAQSPDGEAVVADAEVVDEPPAPQEAAQVEPEPPQERAVVAPGESPAPEPERAPEPPPAAQGAPGGPLAALFASQEAQAPPPKESVQQELATSAPAPAPTPEPAPAQEPPAPAEPALEPAPSVPGADIEDLRADLAYWTDVRADPEYREQQGMSEEEVDANVAELSSAIAALEQEEQG